ncbi:MAG: OmpA family protein [Prevotellaceae bacterium]|nr:OmpA family protein [Prevotellaceae bacterium]
MIKKPFYILSILSAFLLAVLVLVSCGAERNFKRAERHLALGEYFDAANEYKQAYQKTPPKNRERRALIASKMAFCYDKSLQTGKAVAAYRNVIRYKQANMEEHLALARQLMKEGSYAAAEAEFKLVLDSLPDNTLAKEGLIAAKNAPQTKEAGSRYTVKKMDIFNSRRADYSPMLFGDAYDQLYFTSTRNEAMGDELSGITGTKAGDLFYSQKDDKGKWSKPEAVNGGVNTNYDEGTCCFSPDGREMYLTQCATSPSFPRYAQIVKSDRSDAAWGKATPITLTGDTLSSFAHPAISPDGQWLYFTSDMPGGKGGLDIWRVRITPAGFGGVENLGEPVNTAGDEEFPTFRTNGDLYFSSNGHPGLGGLDIFIAKVGKDRRYHLSHPGFPLNSQGDDFGMTFEGPYNRGFFSSNRGDGRGWDHIYSFENPEITQTVKGWVYEMDGYELPSATVYCIGDDGTNERIALHSDGSFTKLLNPGVTYLFMATCKGYLNHQEEIKALPNPRESTDSTLQFALANISAPTLIDNIFYDFNKATLRDSSKTALDHLVALLKENGNVTIELSAHCDYKGSAEYNKRLSQRRAEAVVAYLIQHGIAADRLTPVGYGKEKPKIIKKKLTEKYKWLKEGDVLTPEFIQKLKDKSKEEICNQLNRRTEFTVLRTTYGMFDKDGKLKNIPKPKPQKDANTEDNGFNIIIE